MVFLPFSPFYTSTEHLAHIYLSSICLSIHLYVCILSIHPAAHRRMTASAKPGDLSVLSALPGVLAHWDGAITGNTGAKTLA